LREMKEGVGLEGMKEWKWRVAFVLWRSDKEFMFFLSHICFHGNGFQSQKKIMLRISCS
jgi:hypothetical protein